MTVKYTYVPLDQLTQGRLQCGGLDGQGGVTVVKTLRGATTSHLEGFEYNLSCPPRSSPGYSYLGLAEWQRRIRRHPDRRHHGDPELRGQPRYQFRVDFINDTTTPLIETV